VSTAAAVGRDDLALHDGEEDLDLSSQEACTGVRTSTQFGQRAAMRSVAAPALVRPGYRWSCTPGWAARTPSSCSPPRPRSPVRASPHGRVTCGAPCVRCRPGSLPCNRRATDAPVRGVRRCAYRGAFRGAPRVGLARWSPWPWLRVVASCPWPDGSCPWPVVLARGRRPSRAPRRGCTRDRWSAGRSDAAASRGKKVTRSRSSARAASLQPSLSSATSHGATGPRRRCSKLLLRPRSASPTPSSRSTASASSRDVRQRGRRTRVGRSGPHSVGLASKLAVAEWATHDVAGSHPQPVTCSRTSRVSATTHTRDSRSAPTSCTPMPT